MTHPFHRAVNLTPKSYINVTLTISLSIVFLILWVADNQPYFDLPLSWNDTEGALVVTDMPAGADLGIHPGDRLVNIANSNGVNLDLHRKFLTTLPRDRQNNYPDKQSYFQDRAALYEIARSDRVILTFSDGDQMEIKSQTGLPLKHRSQGFWIRLSMGLFIWICAISVWMWQPGRPELASLGISSTAMMICATGQALYADIPNIYSPQFDWWLNLLVNAGLITATCSALGIFFSYPKKFTNAEKYLHLLWIGTPLLIVFLLAKDWKFGIAAEDQALYIDDWELYSTILLVYITAVVVLLLQLFRSKGNSQMIRGLGWALVVTILGPGIYVLLRAVPSMLSIEPILTRDASWGVFGLLYLIIVVVIANTNLLNLGRQVATAWRWILLGLVFLILDLLVVKLFSLNFSEQLFFLFSLALIGYIPLRQRLYQWLSNHDADPDQRFGDALKTLLNDSIEGTTSPADSWRQMLKMQFDPISIASMGSTQHQIKNSGKTLIIATNRYSTAYQLDYADHGARSFSDGDTRRVIELRNIFERLWDYQTAYSAGGTDERNRLRRDLHDHVGHKLLSMIHAAPDQTSRELAQEAMTELAHSIKNLKSPIISLVEFGKAFQVAVESICASTNLGCTCKNGIPNTDHLASATISRSLLSAVQEILNNVVRHARATHIEASVSISDEGTGLNLLIKDNGDGFDKNTITPGDGLKNIQARINELSGTVQWSFSSGTEVNIQLPISKTL